METAQEEVREVAIPEFPGYSIDTNGNVWSYRRNYKKGDIRKKRAIDVNWDGYARVFLFTGTTKKRFQVHRLVAIAFIPNPENKPQVNHIDGNTLNNTLGNLEWCTISENAIHAYKHLGRKANKTALGKTGSLCIFSKPVIQMDMDGNFIAEFDNQRIASEKTAGAIGKISMVCNGKRNHSGGFKWKYKEVEGV